jgi:CHAD domain-containing protein
VHAVRKAARRLRYALEAAGDLADVGHRRLGVLKHVQETLGDALDAEHAADAYREVARLAAADGADTFGFGALATVESAVARDRLERYRLLAAKL